MSFFPFRVFIILLCLSILNACNKSDAASTQADISPNISVQVETVAQGELVRVLTGTTSLEAEQSATLVSETGGEVLQLLVEEGDVVAKGQVLARLDSARARLQVAEQAVVKNRLAHENKRSARLLDAHMISSEEVERTRFDFAAQSAALDMAKVQLAKSDIRAPFSGVITRRHIKLGQMLASSMPAFDLADFSSLQARLPVPEAALGQLRTGQYVKIGADAFPNETFTGKVLRIAAVVDAKSGTAPVTIDVNEQDTALRPGQFVRVTIELERIQNAVLLPKSAVQNNREQPSIFVIENGVALRREVVLGAEQGDQVQVLQGVAPGSEVVTIGQGQISDQAQVNVIRSDNKVMVTQVTAIP